MRYADFGHQIRFFERHSSKEYHRTGEVDIDLTATYQHGKRPTTATGTIEAVFDVGWLAHRQRHIERVLLR